MYTDPCQWLLVLIGRRDLEPRLTNFRLATLETRICGVGILIEGLPGQVEELGGGWGQAAPFAPGQRYVSAERGLGEGGHRHVGPWPLGV